MYHLKFGAAIGTKFAPPFTNNIMEGLQIKTSASTPHKPFLKLRYFLYPDRGARIVTIF